MHEIIQNKSLCIVAAPIWFPTLLEYEGSVYLNYPLILSIQCILINLYFHKGVAFMEKMALQNVEKMDI